MQLEFEHQTDDYRIHSALQADGTRLELVAAHLEITRVKLKHDVSKDLYTKLNQMEYIEYPYHHYKLIGPMTAESGATTFNRIVARERRPQAMFVFMIPAVNDYGIRTKNPYNFVNANVTSAQMFFEDRRYPETPFTPNFGTALAPEPNISDFDVTRELYALYSALGTLHSNVPMSSVDRNSFLHGTTFIPFTFDPQGLSSQYNNVDTEKGDLSLALSFGGENNQGGGLTEPLNIYCIGVYQQTEYLHRDGTFRSSS
jgi:hypothetical protein